MPEGRLTSLDIGPTDQVPDKNSPEIRRTRPAIDTRGLYGTGIKGYPRRKRLFSANFEFGGNSKILKQILVCLLIFVMAVGLKGADFPMADSLKAGAKYLMTTETDFSPLAHSIVRVAGQWSNVDWPSLDPEVPVTTKPVISQVPKGIGLTLPLGGKVLVPFGWVFDEEREALEFHSGVDIEAIEGETVEVAGSGTVMKVYTSESGRGTVIINHDDKTSSQYTNLMNIPVNRGDKVEQGQKIGEIEAVKNAPTHLHFEVRYYGKPVDPLGVAAF